MSETLYMRISTQNSVLIAPDAHMPYITQLYIMSIQPATKAVEHLVSSYKRERERDEGIKRERVT